jgi:hypothetical protein
MTYQVEVSRCGETITTFEGIEALSPLEAIERVEKHYKTQRVHLDDETVVEWTGCEFQARRLGMVLS